MMQWRLKIAVRTHIDSSVAYFEALLSSLGGGLPLPEAALGLGFASWIQAFLVAASGAAAAANSMRSP